MVLVTLGLTVTFVVMFCFGWWLGGTLSNSQYKDIASKAIKVMGITALWLVISMGGLSSNIPNWLNVLVVLAYITNVVNVVVSK